MLNERAIAVMERMSDKLTGRDFQTELRAGADYDSIPVQVPTPAPCCLTAFHAAFHSCRVYMQVFGPQRCTCDGSRVRARRCGISFAWEAQVPIESSSVKGLIWCSPLQTICRWSG